MKLKKLILTLVIAVFIFGAGFLGGMEYKAYQIRSAFTDSLFSLDNDTPAATAGTPVSTSEPEPTIIQKAIGDNVQLATIDLKVNSANERQNISSSYGSPKVAIEGAKFVVVNIDVINTTDGVFYFSPDFVLMDNRERKFEYYSDMIGSIDDYLMGDISPSIKRNGNVVFEIPSDAESYSVMISKAGTNEAYQIVLK